MKKRWRWLMLAAALVVAASIAAVMLARGDDRPPGLAEIRDVVEDVAGRDQVTVAKRTPQQTELLVQLPEERLSVIVAERRLEIEERVPPKGDESLGIFHDRLAMTYPESRRGKCLEQRLMELVGIHYAVSSPITMDNEPPAPKPPNDC